MCLPREPRSVPTLPSSQAPEGEGGLTHLSWSGGAWGEAQLCELWSRQRDRSLVQEGKQMLERNPGEGGRWTDFSLLSGLYQGSCTRASKGVPLSSPTSRIQDTGPVP